MTIPRKCRSILLLICTSFIMSKFVVLKHPDYFALQLNVSFYCTLTSSIHFFFFKQNTFSWWWAFFDIRYLYNPSTLTFAFSSSPAGSSYLRVASMAMCLILITSFSDLYNHRTNDPKSLYKVPTFKECILAPLSLFWRRGVLLFPFLFIIQDCVLNQGQECKKNSTPKLHYFPELLKRFHY